MPLSGFLSGFLVDDMMVSSAAAGLLVPANDTEEDGDEGKEQAARQSQADYDFFRRGEIKKIKEVRTQQL